MKKITGEGLLKLGFKKQIEPTLDSIGYHYYTYEIGKKTLLISCSNDEKVDGGYEVEFYEIPRLAFRNLSDLKKLVKLLNRVNNE